MWVARAFAEGCVVGVVVLWFLLALLVLRRRLLLLVLVLRLRTLLHQPASGLLLMQWRGAHLRLGVRLSQV